MNPVDENDTLDVAIAFDVNDVVPGVVFDDPVPEDIVDASVTWDSVVVVTVGIVVVLLIPSVGVLNAFICSVLVLNLTLSVRGCDESAS